MSREIILLVGQSNMAGRGLPGEVDPIADRRIEMFRDGQWQAAVEPLHDDKETAGVGLAMSCASAYLETFPHARVGLVPAAVGGTPLSRWMPGEDLYERALGIARDDRAARLAQAARNLDFFGAPVGLIVTLDRSLCEAQFIDIGIFVQSILLLAQERGLATCPQASWTLWSSAVREALEIPDGEMVVVGIALGHAAADAPVNHIRQPRQSLAEFATLLGFDEADSRAA